MQQTEVKDKNEILEDANFRVYELGYLLVPIIAQDDASIIYGNLKELVLSFQGEIISDEIPKMISLAYSMQKTISNIRHKFNTAYFGWIKFIMNSETVLELKKKLDFQENIIRFLILKTVKENTIASKRFIRGDTTYKRSYLKKNIKNENIVLINKEEIDKKIDALVAV